LAPHVFKDDALLHSGNLYQEKAQELAALDGISDLILLLDIAGLAFKRPGHEAVAGLGRGKLYLFAGCDVVESWGLVDVRSSKDHIVDNRKFYLSLSAFKSYLADRVGCFYESDLLSLFKSKVLSSPMR
jgi:hypothetical protein